MDNASIEVLGFLIDVVLSITVYLFVPMKIVNCVASKKQITLWDIKKIIILDTIIFYIFFMTISALMFGITGKGNMIPIWPFIAYFILKKKHFPKSKNSDGNESGQAEGVQEKDENSQNSYPETSIDKNAEGKNEIQKPEKSPAKVQLTFMWAFIAIITFALTAGIYFAISPFVGGSSVSQQRKAESTTEETSPQKRIAISSEETYYVFISDTPNAGAYALRAVVGKSDEVTTVSKCYNQTGKIVRDRSTNYYVSKIYYRKGNLEFDNKPLVLGKKTEAKDIKGNTYYIELTDNKAPSGEYKGD